MDLPSGNGGSVTPDRTCKRYSADNLNKDCGIVLTMVIRNVLPPSSWLRRDGSNLQLSG